MISAELMYEKVMHRMDMTKETKEEELQEIIRTVLEDESKKEFRTRADISYCHSASVDL